MGEEKKGFPTRNPPEAPPQLTLLAQCIRLHMVHMVKHVWFCVCHLSDIVNRTRMWALQASLFTLVRSAGRPLQLRPGG